MFMDLKTIAKKNWSVCGPLMEQSPSRKASGFMLVYRMSAIDASSAMAKYPLASVVGAFPDGRDNWLGPAPGPQAARPV